MGAGSKISFEQVADSGILVRGFRHRIHLDETVADAGAVKINFEGNFDDANDEDDDDDDNDETVADASAVKINFEGNFDDGVEN